jgi:hypothetical protein
MTIAPRGRGRFNDHGQAGWLDNHAIGKLIKTDDWK